MKPVNDAPQRSKTALAAPATAILKDDRHAERVLMIYEEKYDHLCLLAIKYLNQSEVFAEDIVADVFIDALTKWSTERYDGINNLEAYICQSVIFKSKNFRKRHGRLVSMHDLPLDTLTNTNPMMKMDLDMDGITNLLPTKQREAFSLYCKGYTHAEIAKMLQLSGEGASKNLIYYAKKKLQKIWSGLPEDDPDNPGASGSRKKAPNKTKHNTRPLTTVSGYLPKVKDLLNYIGGHERSAQTRTAIWLWILKDSNAIEIISALSYILDSNIGTNIEARLKKGKDSLRDKLYAAIPSKNVPYDRLKLNTSQSFLHQLIIQKDTFQLIPINGIPYIVFMKDGIKEE